MKGKRMFRNGTKRAGLVAIICAGIGSVCMAQEGPFREGQMAIISDPNGNTMVKIGDGDFVPIEGLKGIAPGMGGSKAVNMELAHQRASNTLKEELACTEEEWAVIGPKILKIQTLQGVVGERVSGRIGGTPTANVQAIVNDVQTRRSDLQEVVRGQGGGADVRSRLASLRKARETAAEELAIARKELVDVLTASQEAVLFLRDILR